MAMNLFSPKDWKCPACGNINWQKRESCNQCNAPKPGMIGDREGRGGGFKEREEVIEYRQSRFEDADDEYDDFGRLKKKGHKTLAGTATASSKHNSDGRQSPKKPVVVEKVEYDDFGRLKKKEAAVVIQVDDKAAHSIAAEEKGDDDDDDDDDETTMTVVDGPLLNL
ncbi:hypothetical protein BASA60_010048 [Batrachochytrium salamandrivorans]|nr:hypothetical protein BASA60_010048 [Batrachochytrium salamandrivorans]